MITSASTPVWPESTSTFATRGPRDVNVRQLTDAPNNRRGAENATVGFWIVSRIPTYQLQQ